MRKKAKIGRGRPRLPAGEALTVRLQVRMRPDEVAAARAAAGGDVSAWVRGLILAALGPNASRHR